MTRFRRLTRLAWIALGPLLVPLPALATTSDVSPTGFLVSVREETTATPQQLYVALGQVGRWWNGRHSFSGSAANLSLALEAGSCFCERWGNNSVQHGRVVHAAENRLLRLDAALGPLQALAVDGVLTFAIVAANDKTALQVTYRVAGPLAAGLEGLAGPVDGVITEQTKRLVRYVETGRPE